MGWIQSTKNSRNLNLRHLVHLRRAKENKIHPFLAVTIPLYLNSDRNTKFRSLLFLVHSFESNVSHLQVQKKREKKRNHIQPGYWIRYIIGVALKIIFRRLPIFLDNTYYTRWGCIMEVFKYAVITNYTVSGCLCVVCTCVYYTHRPQMRFRFQITRDE